MMSVVFLAGPLSGLIVQPVVGVLSDSCKSSLGRRRPFIIAGCILSSVAVLLLGFSTNLAAILFEDGGVAVSRFRAWVSTADLCPVAPQLIKRIPAAQPPHDRLRRHRSLCYRFQVSQSTKIAHDGPFTMLTLTLPLAGPQHQCRSGDGPLAPSGRNSSKPPASSQRLGFKGIRLRIRLRLLGRRTWYVQLFQALPPATRHAAAARAVGLPLTSPPRFSTQTWST